MVTRFVQRWSKRALYRIFAPWHSYVTEQKEQLVLLQRFAQRWHKAHEQRKVVRIKAMAENARLEREARDIMLEKLAAHLRYEDFRRIS